ncbi:MAG: FtsX-like permease family protein, partial [Terriglobales bacterium]
LTGAIRAMAAGLDPRLRVRSISAFSHRLDEMLQRDQLVSQLSAIFGGLALALACLGLFGVLSYTVAARGPEFGLRMALGAARGSVLALVLREAALLVSAGVAIGLLLALGAGRLLQPLLPGTGAGDPVALIGAAALMFVLPLVSALPPAWRATRNDPARVLRAD